MWKQMHCRAAVMNTKCRQFQVSTQAIFTVALIVHSVKVFQFVFALSVFMAYRNWELTDFVKKKALSVARSLGTGLTAQHCQVLRGMRGMQDNCLPFISISAGEHQRPVLGTKQICCGYRAMLEGLSNVARAQGPLLLPWWPVGWDPCGKESPCK